MRIRIESLALLTLHAARQKSKQVRSTLDDKSLHHPLKLGFIHRLDTMMQQDRSEGRPPLVNNVDIHGLFPVRHGCFPRSQ